MITPRDEVVHTPRAEHGGRNALEHTDGLDVRRDFSVCLNAFGPADVVTRAVRNAPLDEYPDPKNRAPRHAAAKHWDLPAEEIIFGAGAAELIHAACFAFVRRNDSVAIAGPSFGEYARAAQLCGARVMRVPLTIGGDARDFAERITVLRPRIVFIASPVSPTGEVVPTDALEEIAGACAMIDALLVLDQAYDAFCEHSLGRPALIGHPSVLHLHSLTKEHALAGVRAGFGMTSREVARAIEAVRIPWAASAQSQAAAVACFTDSAQSHVARTTSMLRTERARIVAACAQRGIETRPTATHFFLARVNDAPNATSRLREEHGILVRDCTSFGLPQWVRIAARTPDDNDYLIDALGTLSPQVVHRTAV
ncbi:MAG TPA: histidinol-phosphate transaminase [Gemmatimonadaceae bacterium]